MKKVNIILFGIGNVGSTLIQQLLDAKKQWEKHSGVSVNIPVIANSKKALFNAEGPLDPDWRSGDSTWSLVSDEDLLAVCRT